VKRRCVIQVPGAAALGTALPVFAQSQRAMPLGLLYIVPESDPAVAPVWRGFWLELKRLGWEEARNLVVERAFSGPNVERLPDLARELVRKGVDVISTGTVLLKEIEDE
jgi:hypothetical protein